MLKKVGTNVELHGNQLFREKLSAITSQSNEWYLMVFRLDNFKNINDLYSYSFGDIVLQTFLDDLQKEIQDGFLLYHLDGNSFGILSECEEAQTIIDMLTMIQKVAQKTRKIQGFNVSLSISAGICNYPKDGTTSTLLYRNAKLAMSRARKDALHHFVIYQEFMSEEAQRDMTLLEDLKYSVEHQFNGFSLNYQPLMRNEGKVLFGCEALLRFQSKTFPNGISPFIFVPVLEQSGLILNVGQWIIDTAFSQCAKWREIMPNFQMNVNVSPQQFEEDGFIQTVLATLKKYDLDPSAITLELTESRPSKFDIIRKAFNYLRKHGLKTAFDDFGTGYASVDIFRAISGDELKIDRSFLERITYDVTDQVLLKSIIDMCKAMGILVCIEGVETTDIEHIVSSMNPDLLQGYLYSKPLPTKDFEKRFLFDFIEEHGDHQKEVHPTMVYAPLRPAKPMLMTEIVNNAYAGIFQVGMDEEFTFLACNEGYRRMLGYTSREIEEKFSNKALAFAHPDDADWVNQEIRRQLGRGDSLSSDFRIVRKDGKAIWVHGTGNVVHSEEGNSSLIVTIVDVDKEKRQALHNEEQLALYETIMENVPAGIKYLKFDKEFSIEYISPGFLSLLGYTQTDMQSLFHNKFLNIIFEEDRERTLTELQEQSKHSSIIRIPYRCYCKNGTLLWVETVSRLCEPDAHGIQHCCSCIVDVRNIENTKEILDEAQRFPQASKFWEDVMLEYNFESEKIVFSKRFESMSGYACEDHSLTIHELFGKDADAFYEALEIAKQNKQPSAMELQMKKFDGTLLWTKVQLNSAEFVDEKPVTVIGKITDIHHAFEEREQKEKEHQLDFLTQLSSKGVLEDSINQKIQENSNVSYALLIIDIDDFTSLNKEYGQMIGDMVLKTLALRIRNSFRDSDIIGRLGGDEFLVFIQYNGEQDMLHKRCAELMKSMNSSMKFKDLDVFSIHVSMGVSCYPKDGCKFSQLYENADKALYRIKKERKNNYLICD